MQHNAYERHGFPDDEIKEQPMQHNATENNTSSPTRSSAQRTNGGFSLVELTVASLILSVGSLAVLKLSIHWHSSLNHANTRMQQIDQLIEARPLPRIERRYEFLSCERDK